MKKSGDISKNSIYVLVGLLFLLMFLVFLDSGGFTGRFFYSSGETLFVPCNDEGAYDLARELVWDYEGSYCFEAANGNIGNDVVILQYCGNEGYFNLREWEERCHYYYAQLL